MEKNQPGLTTEERETLATQPEEDKKEMDLKMSLLAFASLLLVCALIVAASLIARSQARNDSTKIGGAPLHQPAGAASRAGNGQQPQSREEQPQADVSF